MITVTQQEELVNRFESLSELELQSVLEDLSEVIRKRKWEHLIVGLFDEELNDKMMDKLADETSDLETRILNLEDDLQSSKNKVMEAIKILKAIE